LVVVRMNEVASDPDAHLGEVCVPTKTRPCYLHFLNEFPRPVLVTLYIDRLDSQRILRVRSARLSTRPPADEEE
jgi:hypothetical protein